MTLFKKLIALIAALASTSTAICAVQVLPPPPPGVGHELGKGLGNGFSRGMEMAIAKKQREREREKIQKEQEKQIAYQKAILEEILKDYKPSKNASFVLNVLRSELPLHTKEVVINALNEQHKAYLEEQSKNRGVMSWFRLS